MTTVRPDIDLEAFARPESRPRRRRRWTRLLLPGAILAGLVAVLGWSLGDLLRARTDVTVVRPKTGELGAGAGGAVAFQASGWVEPDPFPKRVTPLTRGTVAEILVQESDILEKGDPVARLVPDEADLELAAARATLARTTAERARARIELEAAKKDFEEAIRLTERVEVARAAVAGKVAERGLLTEAARRMEAEVHAAGEELAIQKHLRAEGAAGPRQVELAAARLESARAAHAAARARVAHADAELSAARAKEKSARREQQLRIEDQRRLASAQHGLDAAEAAVHRARAELALAELRKERMTVRSPWDGVVLERLTVPGATVGGEGLAHTSICSLYDPRRLRVRVDVPQEQVAQARLGQKARIVSKARRARPYHGTVARIVQQADNQKVSLQAHVRVEDPDELLRPEMLCQVRFVGAGGPGEGGETPATILVPHRLLDGDRLWVLDPTGKRAIRRRVQVGGRQGEWIEVLAGVNLSDKLVDRGRDGLIEGALVRVREGGQ